jgi:hypothetical protein
VAALLSFGQQALSRLNDPFQFNLTLSLVSIYNQAVSLS